MGRSSSLDDPIWRLIKASIRTRNQICDFKMWCLHDLTLRAKPSCAEPSPASSSCPRSPGSSACSSGVEGPRPWEGRLSGLSCRRTQCIQRRPRANPYLQRKRNSSKPSRFLPSSGSGSLTLGAPHLQAAPAVWTATLPSCVPPTGPSVRLCWGFRTPPRAPR